jgi:hypothetical protein
VGVGWTRAAGLHPYHPENDGVAAGVREEEVVGSCAWGGSVLCLLPVLLPGSGFGAAGRLRRWEEVVAAVALSRVFPEVEGRWDEPANILIDK